MMRPVIAGLSACLLLAAAPLANAAPRACQLLTDPAGDATRQAYVGETPTPNDAAADILGMTVWRDALKIHFKTTVAAAPQADADSPSGYLYDLRVTVEGQEYSISANTGLDGQTYSLTKVTPPNSPAEVEDGAPLTGTFDSAAHTVQVDVPVSRLRQITHRKSDAFSLTAVRMFTMRAFGTAVTGWTYTTADFADDSHVYDVHNDRCR